MQVGELDLGRGQRRRAVEPARHAGLAAAIRTRAQPAQRFEAVDRRVAVGPVELGRAGSPVRVDAGRGRRRSRRSRVRRLGHHARDCRTPPKPTPDLRPSGGATSRGLSSAAMSLDIDRVTKRFGPTVALDDLSFSVPRGRIFGFLGANGAGKTTTMRICLGILHADSGAVRWDGRPTGDLARRTFGYLPEERGLYPRSTVIDQLVYFASLYGETARDARANAQHWLDRFRIPEYAPRRAEELSKGNQQKVQFIAAILHGPEVLLMDEPFTGLDPVNLALLRDAFLELRDAGRTIVFSTHQMEAAEALCESLAIVDHGRLVAGGTLGELKRTSRAR